MVRCAKNRFERSGGMTYRVPWPVLDAFIHNRNFELRRYENLSNEDFFAAMCEIFDQRSDNDISTETTKSRLQLLMNYNAHLPFVQ